MKKYLKNSIALLIIMSLVINLVAVNANAESTSRTIEVDGHVFNVVTDSDDISSVTCTEDNITYNVVMNNKTRDVAIQKSKSTLLSSEVIEDYSVNINSVNEDTIDYSVKDNINHTTLNKKDTFNNIQKHQDTVNDGKMHGQVAIDLGIALVVLLIAVLAVAVVYTYNNIDYSYFSDVISAVKTKAKENKKYYYYACIYNNVLTVGNSFTSYATALAYAKTILNSRMYGVYCTGSGYAYGLACSAGSYYGTSVVEIHGAQPDYQYHYHPMKTSTERYSEHIWYY